MFVLNTFLISLHFIKVLIYTFTPIILLNYTSFYAMVIVVSVGEVFDIPA